LRASGVTSEADLYAPVKAFLEAQGYEVKSEVGTVDVLAVRGAEPPVVVELKLAASLALFHQGVGRLGVTDAVYLAIAHRPGKRFAAGLRRNIALARRLGLGFLTVRLSDGLVQAHCDPGGYVPRKTPSRSGALLREFARRRGDPNTGGQMRRGLVTAYRQDALAIAGLLGIEGPQRGAEVARRTGVEAATRIMRDNHYGWFARLDRGIYDLTEAGRDAVASAVPGDAT
jgi:hypothetical protein